MTDNGWFARQLQNLVDRVYKLEHPPRPVVRQTMTFMVPDELLETVDRGGLFPVFDSNAKIFQIIITASKTNADPITWTIYKHAANSPGIRSVLTTITLPPGDYCFIKSVDYAVVQEDLISVSIDDIGDDSDPAKDVSVYVRLG